MIATLIPHPEFAPVPYVEIRLTEETGWDGGSPGSSGPDEFDGGAPGETGPDEFDGGYPNTVSVDLPAGTDNLTVWWISEGRTDAVGGLMRRALAPAYQDVETGFDVPTAYEVECFNGEVSLGRVSLGEVILPWAGDENGCIVQQPLNPYLHAVVTNLSGSWPSLTWQAPGELVLTQGASLPSLVNFGPRQGASDVQVDFGAPTREVAARVKATLGTREQPQLPVWLIRTHQGLLPRRFFGHVQALAEVDVNLRAGGEWSRFQSTVTEVARPAPGLLVSPLSYADLDVSYASYAERDAAYTSYAAMDTDWSLAGASG